MGKNSARGGVFACKLCPPVIPVRQRTPNNLLSCLLLCSFYSPLVYKRKKKNRCKFSSKITSFEDWMDRKWYYPVNRANPSCLRPAIRERQLFLDQREIGSIMNDSVTGWEKGAQHRFDIYGQQRSWRRVKAEAFPLIEEQLALPDGWA